MDFGIHKRQVQVALAIKGSNITKCLGNCL